MNMFVLNTQQSNFIFLLLVSVALFSYSVQPMRFEFDLAHDKVGRCFSEEIEKINSMVIGNYSIVNSNKDKPLPPNYTMNVQVYPPQGTVAYHVAERVQAGQFAFTAYQKGRYAICFMDTSVDREVTFRVDFEWKTGVPTASGHHKIAKKSDLDWLALEVQTMHDTALAIKEEMTYLLERNTEMIQLNWITDNRLFLLNFVSFFVCLLVAGLQVWHLKTFFEKKKII
ncbi:transmembrane emp24 domain-containing protein p24delta8-like [Vicia villosa]|uniref:transmembrane emp24 domain-containing protein p24delta8-like n=1 Tax=Vicia villosa TaxID=3911 RepID=UPI00273C8496|nr:transmembrane emp24 domain-containing protein p24delta8-like [Vicia villosa]